ncbi:hypothetical protein [Janibacter cremeus]|uniref:MFS superfamily sulfate permease-like transporter n=1 Tax=Janibacter cremeus TaxID=1285192 RepID=A0A852VJR6_9MICO|nr:hypothetical protein [Janibacter cremeus]NYF97312.1 MFS superfamily sulfate permease-like transporter [Janibacter cremeus]
MSALILRIAGTIVALLGLVGVIVGGWFLSSLGTSGTATFTAAPDQRVVVLAPDVLNRLDSPIEVTATGKGSVWAGTARPSDVEALLGDGPRVEVTGVDVSEWALTSTDVGEGDAMDVRGLDIWQSSTSEDGTVSTTIEQDDAPQTLVITAADGEQVQQVEYRVSDERWSTIAIVVLVVGVVLLLLGLALALGPRMLRARRGRPAAPTHEEVGA